MSPLILRTVVRAFQPAIRKPPVDVASPRPVH